MKRGYARQCFKAFTAYIRTLGYMFRIFFSVLKGTWRISKFKHEPITVFGGARLKPDSIYMHMATELAQMLSERGIPVLTGGGPGIMEAASCGATQTKGTVGVISSLGISVPGLNLTEPPSKCLTDILMIDNYAARKWLLIQYSMAYAVFPGGFGTLNELTEVLTLIQTKLQKKSPIVLIGVEYWKPIMEWIHGSALKQGLIGHEDAALFTLTDDIKEAYDILVVAHETKKKKES